MDEASSWAVRSDKEISKSELDDHWARYAALGDIETRDTLVINYMTLVRTLAERLRADLPQTVELEDLISSGTFGLMSAIDSFDISMGVKFETFATQRVRGAMIDELRNLDWAPRVLRMKAQQIASSIQALEGEHGRPPTDAELAEHSGFDVRKLNAIRRQTDSPGSVSLTASYSTGHDGRDIRGIDVIQDIRTLDPFRTLHRKEIQQTVIDTVESLPRQERLTIILYYFEQLTMKQVGKVLDLSESRVCQIHADIILRLQRRLLRWKEELLEPQRY